MSKRQPDAETPSVILGDYALIALSQLGGSAQRAVILVQMASLLDHRLTQADLMMTVSETTGRPCAVWQRYAEIALGDRAKRLGYVQVSAHGHWFTLTERGKEQILAMAMHWLDTLPR